jgi:Ni/Co efflux regulator RcnB
MSHTLSNSRTLSCALLIVAVAAAPMAHAQDAPAARTARDAPAPAAKADTPARKPGPGDAAKGKGATPRGEIKRPEPDEASRRASEAIVGYYTALIAKDYDQAGSFVHPDFVAPLQVGIAAEVEKSSSEKARKGTLDQFGVADATALKALPPSQFFARFARSQYGTTLQALGDPTLDAKVSTDRILCTAAKTACDVEIVISVVDAATKKRSDRRSSVRAQVSDGRWLVGMKPPPPPPPPPPSTGGKTPGH